MLEQRCSTFSFTTRVMIDLRATHIYFKKRISRKIKYRRLGSLDNMLLWDNLVTQIANLDVSSEDTTGWGRRKREALAVLETRRNLYKEREKK